MPRERPPRPRRRWFRLNLRGLMVLILAIGGLITWPVMTIHRQREAIDTVKAAGGSLSYDYETQETVRPGTLIPTLRDEPAAPRWVRRAVGDELFQNVRGVFLPQLRSTATLAVLPRFDRLESLNLMAVADSAAGWEALGTLTRLGALSLTGPGVTDAALREVGRLPSLRSLLIMDSAVTDAGFRHLSGLANLTMLTVTVDRDAADAGLAHALAGMPRLQTLRLYNEGQPLPATMAALGRHCRDLRVLHLEGTGVTDADLVAIGNLPELRELGLDNTQIGGSGLIHLARLAELTTLDLARTGLTDADLARLGPLPKLRELNCGMTRIGDAALPTIARFPALVKLDLPTSQVTDAGLAELTRSPRLIHLNLAENAAITDAGLATLGADSKLQYLVVSQTSVTPDAVVALRSARPQLTVIGPSPVNAVAPAGPESALLPAIQP